jgi:hypothetical protein
MKVNLYIDAEGMEQFVLGKQLYPWHIIPRLVKENGEFSIYDQPKNSQLIAENVTLNFPGRGTCVSAAQRNLEKLQNETRATAYAEERRLQQRLNDLLMIEHSPAEEQSSATPDDQDLI